MLQQIKKLLTEKNLDGFLQNRTDIFLNEYIKEQDNFLTPLTGFTGSQGLALVTRHKNYLLVDGRYDEQAKNETDKNWQVIGPTTSKGRRTIDIIAEILLTKNKKPRLGFIPHFFSHQQITAWQQQNITWVKLTPHTLPKITTPNTAIEINNNRFPEQKIFDYKIMGETRQAKIKKIITPLQKKNIGGLLIGDNGNLSWLLNLRAFIIPYNPIINGIGFLTTDKNPLLHLFIPTKFLHDHINKSGIQLHPLQNFSAFIKQWQKKSKQKIMFSGTDCSYHITSLIDKKYRHLAPDPITLAKAIKNTQEQQGAKIAHEKDGIAMVRFFHWLEKSMLRHEPIDEKIIADQLWRYRKMDKDCLSPSFPTIAAIAKNAALPHYQTTDRSNKKATTTDILLLDSGAHYIMGTTDITRTIILSPNNFFKTSLTDDFAGHYNMVLKGHLALARATFPQGITGSMLDSLARAPLWSWGLDYQHGTGHGIGSFLPVHEGPQNISPRHYHGEPAMMAGMITSNEPGFYRPNFYGIRIENVELCVEYKKNQLGFESLTLCPIDTAPLKYKNLLTPDEITQLNDYHQKVYQQLSPHLSGDEKNWLKEKTAPL